MSSVRASLVCAGCMAERLKMKLLESDKLVDLVAGPDAYRDLPALIEIVQVQVLLSVSVILYCNPLQRPCVNVL